MDSGAQFSLSAFSLLLAFLCTEMGIFNLELVTINSLGAEPRATLISGLHHAQNGPLRQNTSMDCPEDTETGPA